MGVEKELPGLLSTAVMGGAMSDLSNEPWQQLFVPAASEGAVTTVKMRLLRRHRRPFLLLPCSADLAAKSLALYAPQTRWARLATSVLRIAVKAGLSAVLERV